MTGPGGTPMDAWPAEPKTKSEWDEEARRPPAAASGSYTARLAEAERAVLATALRWFQDLDVASDELADVVGEYADLLDSSERGL